MTFENMKVQVESFEENEVFEALVNNNERWNGWLVPFFTMEEVRKLKPVLDRIGEGQLGITITDNTVCEFIESESWEVPTMVVNGITYYNVGDGYCWDSID